MQNFIRFTLLVILLSGCYAAQPEREAEALPFSGIESWEEAFARTPVIDSFKILNTGAVKVPVSGMLNTKKLPADHPFGQFIWVDVYSFLFHHRENGWYLIDTGLDSTFQQKGNIWGLMSGKYIKGTRQEPGQNIGAQLERENKSISGIFLTHLHGDHTAGLPEIDPSIPKYVAKQEDYIQIPLLYRSNHLTTEDVLRELDWENGSELDPFRSAMDVFGDGSFYAIHTPGHSSSHLSYLLFTQGGPILLTGDASHTKYGFYNGIEPGWGVDREKAEDSLRQLKTFKERYPAVRVIYGHQQ